jgi:hypothetical protein
VGWIDLDIYDAQNRAVQRIKIPLSPDARTGPDDWLGQDIRQTSVGRSSRAFTWDGVTCPTVVTV